MNNVHTITVTHESIGALYNITSLIWDGQSESTAVAFHIEGSKMTLYWLKAEGTTALPVPVRSDRAASLIADFLQHVTYPAAPNTDGHAVKGFYVANKAESPHAVLTVEPTWIIYGK